MRITIASGKGGVGKSMIASALATFFAKEKSVIAVDCDVDAPNLAIWLGIDNSDPRSARVTKEISTVDKPEIDLNLCDGCGVCVEGCQFNALELKQELNENKKASVVSYRCEGCGLCSIVCPQKAISMNPVKNCTLSVYDSKFGFQIVQGQIKPGEAESGEAVTEIRKYAETVGSEDTLYLQDAAAGIGCPVIASIVGSDYVVAVAEPSLSSFSDMRRVLEVVDQFNVPWGVVVNKVDLNQDISKDIQKFAGRRMLGSIRYDSGIISAVSSLTPVLESGLAVEGELKEIFEKIEEVLEEVSE